MPASFMTSSTRSVASPPICRPTLPPSSALSFVSTVDPGAPSFRGTRLYVDPSATGSGQDGAEGQRRKYGPKNDIYR